MYEDVTVDVQPDPERHLTQGWIYGFGDGPGGYPQEWTAAKSSNWHAFLDPNEEWDQTIYRNNSAVVRQVDLCLQNAKRARAYDGWNPAWLKFIERNLGAWMHAENGLALHVFTSIQRSGPTNMINTAVAVNAAHKMRFAQDLALFNLDLSEAVEAFDGAAHKEVWQNAPEWQPTREVVERLTAVGDWCELLFATNIVFEQLVGSLFRSELVMQIAARNGDYITPTIVGTGEHDYDRDLGLHPQPVPAADPGRASSARPTRSCSASGWRPGCRAASTPPTRCSRSGRSRPRRPSHSRPASTRPSRSSVPCSRTLELDTPEGVWTSEHAVRISHRVLQQMRRDPDEHPDRPRRRRGDGRQGRRASSPSTRR